MTADRIDVHTHILPPSWPDLLALTGYGGWPRLERNGARSGRIMIDDRLFREVGDDSWDPSCRLEAMDRDGVELQVLSTVPVMFSYWAPGRDGLVLARAVNDHIAGVVADHPSRFSGLGTVPLQDPDLAIAELERCVRELGLEGIEIGTHAGGRELDDPAIVDVLAAAADLGAAVFVHPWEMLAPERMTRHWLPWLVGMPAELALAISSLVLGGVLERLPTLRILFAHGGGAFPAILGRLDAGYRARPDLVATATALPPSAQVGRFYVDSLVHDPATLRFVMERLGPDSIALGTDYPFPLGEQHPGATIDALPGLAPAVHERMRRGTALTFLGRRVPA